MLESTNNVSPPAFYPKRLAEAHRNHGGMSETFRDLPPSFVHNMKGLFDYFDIEKNGRIPLESMASRWNPQRAEDENLPPDLMTHLEKVTDRRGLLTFERFCAGLKIAILRYSPALQSSNSNDSSSLWSGGRRRRGTFSTDSSLNRTSSLPNILKDNSSLSTAENNSSLDSEILPYVPPPPPPKPPRTLYRTSSGDSSVFLTSDGLPHNPYVDISMVPTTSTTNLRVMPPSYRLSHRLRRQQNPKRQTLQCAPQSIHTNFLKDLEHEQSLLEEGLRIVKKVQNDFVDKLYAIKERLKVPIHNGTSYVEESNYDRLQHIQDVNKTLSTVDLANLNREKSNHNDCMRLIERLRDQNKMLTDEVGDKCRVISSMEKEKGAIIKELFQARSVINQLTRKSSRSSSVTEDSIITFI